MINDSRNMFTISCFWLIVHSVLFSVMHGNACTGMSLELQSARGLRCYLLIYGNQTPIRDLL